MRSLKQTFFNVFHLVRTYLAKEEEEIAPPRGKDGTISANQALLALKEGDTIRDKIITNSLEIDRDYKDGIRFENTEFQEHVTIKADKFSHALLFINCEFSKGLTIKPKNQKSTTKIEEGVQIKNSKIQEKFLVTGCEFTGGLSIERTEIICTSEILSCTFSDIEFFRISLTEPMRLEKIKAATVFLGGIISHAPFRIEKMNAGKFSIYGGCIFKSFFSLSEISISIDKKREDRTGICAISDTLFKADAVIASIKCQSEFMMHHIGFENDLSIHDIDAEQEGITINNVNANNWRSAPPKQAINSVLESYLPEILRINDVKSSTGINITNCQLLNFSLSNVEAITILMRRIHMRGQLIIDGMESKNSTVIRYSKINRIFSIENIKYGDVNFEGSTFMLGSAYYFQEQETFMRNMKTKMKDEGFTSEYYRFYSLEMRAKLIRFQKERLFVPLRYMLWLYGFTSEFGQSIAKPLAFIVLLMSLSTLVLTSTDAIATPDLPECRSLRPPHEIRVAPAWYCTFQMDERLPLSARLGKTSKNAFFFSLKLFFAPVERLHILTPAHGWVYWYSGINYMFLIVLLTLLVGAVKRRVRVA